MNWINIIFGGFGGAIVAAIVAYVIHRQSQEKPTGKAYEILQELGKLLEKPRGEYYFAKSATDNYKIAQLIYGKSDGDIISTTFNENPKIYGETSDLIRLYNYGGSLVTRITCRNVCSIVDEVDVKSAMQTNLKGSNLIVIPETAYITKIDGIFSKLSDDSYLTFIAFRNNDNPEKNKGVIFRDGIAKGFYEYYVKMIEQYE